MANFHGHLLDRDVQLMFVASTAAQLAWIARITFPLPGDSTQAHNQIAAPTITPVRRVAMSTEAMKKLWADFDDLASKSENEDVQFLIRAIKLHAEVMNSRLSALEAAANTAAKHSAK